MRVRKPDWHYEACPGSVLVVQFDWRTGVRYAAHASDLTFATHLIVNLMGDNPDLAYVIVDGFGVHIFGKSADSAPREEMFCVGTRQMYDLWLELAAMQDNVELEMSTMGLFGMIADYMGVKL